MAITADQQAMLQLLLERGQSYEDIAQLLGQDEAEVRARARAALTELGGADPDRNVGLTDYLLGQADPIGRADAVRHLRDDPGRPRSSRAELARPCARCSRRPSCRGCPASRGAAPARAPRSPPPAEAGDASAKRSRAARGRRRG